MAREKVFGLSSGIGAGVICGGRSWGRPVSETDLLGLLREGERGTWLTRDPDARHRCRVPPAWECLMVSR